MDFGIHNRYANVPQRGHSFTHEYVKNTKYGSLEVPEALHLVSESVWQLHLSRKMVRSLHQDLYPRECPLSDVGVPSWLRMSRLVS